MSTHSQNHSTEGGREGGRGRGWDEMRRGSRNRENCPQETILEVFSGFFSKVDNTHLYFF